MSLLDRFTSLFSIRKKRQRETLKKLHHDLRKHEIIQYHFTETITTLQKFSKQRSASKSKNIGMIVRGTMSVGKTKFIVKILSPYFFKIGLIDQNLVYKIHPNGINIQKPISKVLADFRTDSLSLEQIFENLKPGGIIIIDNPSLVSVHSSVIIEQIKILMAAKKHAKTLLVLCASFKKLEKIRAKFEIDSNFPSEFEVKLELSLDQISELFIKYAESKGFRVAQNVIPTLKYYFSLRHQNSKLSNILIGQKKIDSSYYTYFTYKNEFVKLLSSITEINTPNQINISNIRQSKIFLETCDLNQKLKRKYYP